MKTTLQVNFSVWVRARKKNWMNPEIGFGVKKGNKISNDFAMNVMRKWKIKHHDRLKFEYVQQVRLNLFIKARE